MESTCLTIKNYSFLTERGPRPETPRRAKAVGLLSGGLDSTLAARIMQDLNVEVYGVYFSMPWGCCDKTKAQQAARSLGIKFMVLQLDERYLEIIRKPKFGYGSALNPCVDCRIHMFSRAAQYMRQIGADFVFTGEVLGQRPMSQLKKSMTWIEEESDIKGKLLRPLCARLLEPTMAEQEGLIDREKLLAFSGRSRKSQFALAEEFNITEYSPPAGGCLLTDQNFARRMKDTLDYGYRNFRETIALKWGRHFRINEDFKCLLGRDESENLALIQYAHEEDYVMQLENNLGPTLILKGKNPPEDILKTAAGLIQRFSKYKDAAPEQIKYWPARDKNYVRCVEAGILKEEEVERMKI